MPQQPNYDALAKRFNGSSVDYDAMAADASKPATNPAPNPTPAVTPASPSALSTLLDLAKGFGKGAVHTGIDLASMASQSQMIPGVNPRTLPPQVTDMLLGKTAHSNTTQRIGGAAETVAEMAIPVTKAAEAVPSAARAGRAFQEVMGAAKHAAVDTNAPGEVALRIQQLADRGASMPMAVRKFLARITAPDKGEMTYEEARDFASAISRLSANEAQRLTPVVAREVANLRVTLNHAVAKAAEAAGKGPQYKAAMREYAQAMKVKDAVDAVVEGAKKGLPYATAAGAGTWLTMKLKNLLSAE